MHGRQPESVDSGEVSVGAWVRSPNIEKLLAKCAHVIREHDKTALTFASLPDSDEKRAMLAQFAESLRIATDAEQKTREALNRERAKLNYSSYLTWTTFIASSPALLGGLV